MKKSILIAFLTVSLHAVYGQVANEKISRKDSVALGKAWHTFRKELLLKNINALTLLSRKVVFGQCIFERSESNCNSFGSPNELLRSFFKEMFPGNRALILTNKFYVTVYSSKKDKVTKIKYPTQFQIWFINRSEPGYQFAFVFEKLSGKFKFAGLDQIP